MAVSASVCSKSALPTQDQGEVQRPPVSAPRYAACEREGHDQGRRLGIRTSHSPLQELRLVFLRGQSFPPLPAIHKIHRRTRGCEITQRFGMWCQLKSELQKHNRTRNLTCCEECGASGIHADLRGKRESVSAEDMSVVGYLVDVSDPTNYHEVFAGRVSVGRAESNDIKIASRSVSSHHAELELDPATRKPKDGIGQVTDLGSRNATFVNEVRVLNSSVKVEWGAVLRFGYDNTTYRLLQELDEPKG